MAEIIPLFPYTQNIKKYRFAVYTFKLVRSETIFERHFLVIKDDYGIIVCFTRLDKYIKNYKGRLFVPEKSDLKKRFQYIARLFNDIFILNYEKTRAEQLSDITHGMLQQAFQRYADTGVGEQSVSNMIRSCTDFFDLLIAHSSITMQLSSDDLWTEKKIIGSSKKRKRSTVSKVPNFQVRLSSNPKKMILRDMPTKVFEYLLKLALLYMPEISMAIAAGAFAGIRPGEACNIRMDNSPLGRGIFFRYDGTTVKEIRIDLQFEYNLRSDLKKTGGIKKERIQKVYPKFIPYFMQVYEYYKQCDFAYEKDYGALNNNSRGKAMCYKTYRDKFQHLVNHYLIDTLLKSNDMECIQYAHILREYNISPHILRHWFTVKLVQDGLDVYQIADWRGDKSLDAAYTYIQNKSELVKELQETNNQLFDFLNGGNL